MNEWIRSFQGIELCIFYTQYTDVHLYIHINVWAKWKLYHSGGYVQCIFLWLPFVYVGYPCVVYTSLWLVYAFMSGLVMGFYGRAQWAGCKTKNNMRHLVATHISITLEMLKILIQILMDICFWIFTKFSNEGADRFLSHSLRIDRKCFLYRIVQAAQYFQS